MSEPIIKVENLGKRYQLGAHNSGERYTALRDVLSEKAKSLFRRNGALPTSVHRSSSSDSDFWALKDVSFEVQEGEVVGIIGRNGAGKSTLLKILSRITEPTKGKVRIRGRVASLLEVGTGFHPELTGRENIYLNGAILGMSRKEISQKFDEIVAFAEIERFLDTPVKRYSSGMYVRLAFAVAAHLDPEILIVDEVLAVGDAEFQKKCLGKMQEVSKGGRTVLFVTHNMAAIQVLCGRAMCLREGTTCGIGDVRQEISTYLAGANRSDKQAFVGELRVGDTLLLQRFEVSPNPVESEERVAFVVEFLALAATRVNDLAILIYSSSGIRVAIIDLRGLGVPQTLASQEVMRKCVDVSSCSLVEGDYKIGLYVSAGSFGGDISDVITLSVNPTAKQSSYTPYSPMSRGFVELKLAAGGEPITRE